MICHAGGICGEQPCGSSAGHTADDRQATITGRDGTANRHPGTRFDASGRFLTEHGNTVVCQVVPGSATEAAMREVRAGMMALPGPGHFAFPDVASYHMAQFAGVIATRREVGFWSGDLPLVMAIDGMTEAMAAKLGLRRRLRSGSSLQA